MPAGHDISAAPEEIVASRLNSDLANATTTAAKVTGLDTLCGVGTWLFEYFVLYTSSVTTTGIKLGCNHTGTVTSFVYDACGVDTAVTAATGAMDQDALALTGQVMSAWAARAKTTTAPMITVGVDTINVDMLMLISGLAIVTVSGNLELYHASETANTTTVKAGTSLRLTKTA